MNSRSIYKTEQIEEEELKLQYLFESSGKNKIIKAVEYLFVGVLDNRKVFNLGFGDYDEVSGTFIDDTNSNNGDMYTVFNTVLSTVPLFFKKNPSAVIIVSGSDSNHDYINDCLLNCKKKCLTECKNYQRRIKTYRYYIDKNFDQLCEGYIFFGRNKSKTNTVVQYIPKHEYDDILVYNKN